MLLIFSQTFTKNISAERMRTTIQGHYNWFALIISLNYNCISFFWICLYLSLIKYNCCVKLKKERKENGFTYMNGDSCHFVQVWYLERFLIYVHCIFLLLIVIGCFFFSSLEPKLNQSLDFSLDIRTNYLNHKCDIRHGACVLIYTRV